MITVVGGTNGAITGESETAQHTIVLGQQTQIAHPFGYPADGTIMSLDIYPTENGVHCGTFLVDGMSRVCIPGGMDISGEAGTPVFSTMDGTVELAIPNDNGDCSSSTPENSFGHCAWALAGVVYIKKGAYEAAYLHLDNVSVTAGQTVSPGITQLGVTKAISDPEEYCWTTPLGNHICTIGGPHVHYQVRVNGVNKDFLGSFGSCKQGRLLPTSPVPDIEIWTTYVSKGPFTCD